MKTFRFRDFPVYQDARAFRKDILVILKTFPKDERFRLVDQIYRSTQSVILNIAEGSAKHSDPDFARFLEMAIASVNEVVASFDAALDDGLVDAKQCVEIEMKAEHLSKQLGGFIKKLRNS